jgi:xylulokinase
MNFLGIDIGTSAVKAVLVDGHQTVLAQASAGVATHNPRPGWSEQNPDDWWRATEDVVATVRAIAPDGLAAIRAIGLAGQMHCAAILDEAQRPIRPAILWNDNRAVAECAALAGAVPDIGRIAGVIPTPSFTAPKLMWLRAHESENSRRTRHIAFAKDYVRLHLSGELATDMVDAAGSLFLDEAARDWSGRIVTAADIDARWLPRLLEGNAISGMLRREIAASWGIGHPVAIAAGAGDVAAGAVGLGAIADGDGFISLGTSAQIFFARSAYRPKPETLIHAFAHALPGCWFEMAALLNGAGCLDWVARLIGETDAASLLARAEAAATRRSQVFFLPYLAGERTPLNDPEARGVFAGLEYATSADDLVHAVMEGVAFSLADGFNAFGEVTDRESIPLIGGGGRSRAWLQLIASVLDRPLQPVGAAESIAAFGAARLARMAVTGEAPVEVSVKPVVLETVAPDPVLRDALSERLPVFRSLYRSLRRAREATAGRRRDAIP